MFSHQARKRFGQHYLQDQNVINQILAILDPKPGDKIIEIGPGKGALTVPLLKQHQILDVVEIDRDLATDISEKCKNLGVLNVHCMNALDFDFDQFESKQLRIIGNLPYNISTPLLFHFLKYPHCISDMLFMLQKEVADRLAAEPGHKTYGRLSVMVQSQCKVEKLFEIGPESFTPPPKVKSTIIRLKIIQSNHVKLTRTDEFARIVKLAFSQRRKTLKNSLKTLLSEEQIINTGISPDSRAEELTIDQFSLLTKCYCGGENQ